MKRSLLALSIIAILMCTVPPAARADTQPELGPAIEPEEYVGGYNLKLYPKGKSESSEHVQAETFYRLDRHGLKELEINASRR